MNTVINFAKAVTAAGTAEQVISTNEFGYLHIKADKDNTQSIYVGDSDVDSTNGFELEAGEAVTMQVDPLGAIYIDADVNGELVRAVGAVERN